MEKRTPNDGPPWPASSASLGSRFSFCLVSRLLLHAGRARERFGTPRPGQTLYNVHVPWLWTAFCPYFQHFCGSKACPMPEMWVLICSPKYNRGLEHGQPARRTVSKVISRWVSLGF